MCGIIGYVGPREASRVVVEGLRRMEYRGYDSAGVAVVTDGALEVRKKAGKIVNLDAALRAGDRVEIYRPITCDPQSVPRRDGAAGDD